MPYGITSLATHATSTYYWILGKSPLKPKISLYLIQLHGLGLHGLQDPYFKRRIHGLHFHFINWDHNPWHHQQQHMDQAQVMNQSSRPILPLSYLESGFSNNAHIYIKWQQSPRYVISSLTHDPSSWVSLRKLWKSWFGGPRSVFNKPPVV